MKKNQAGKLPPDPFNGSPLAYTTKQLQKALGGVCAKTIKRLEERGHLKPSRLLRHKLYPAEQVRRMLEGGRS